MLLTIALQLFPFRDRRRRRHRPPIHARRPYMELGLCGSPHKNIQGTEANLHCMAPSCSHSQAMHACALPCADARLHGRAGRALLRCPRSP